MPIDHYSIVICTYNPDERILARCLNAVSAFDRSGLKVEIILVDNNSSVKLYEKPYIKDFLKRESHSKLIIEERQGLAYARVAGMKESAGQWVVFLDDDNEPGPSYLQELTQLIKDYPGVGAWGPGTINVDFIDGIDKSVEKKMRPYFQERVISHVEYAMLREYQDCYPAGTGLCVKREILMDYTEFVELGRVTLTGRNGGRMSSGEDMQIVFLGITKGYAAGIAPGLSLTHIIPAQKTNFFALRRLVFGMSSSSITCHAEIFPEFMDNIGKMNLPSSSSFTSKALRRYIKFTVMPRSEFKILEFVNYLGFVAGSYYAFNRALPSTIQFILRRLKVLD